MEFDSVLFDCDSTLARIEGIDELAAFKNARDDISRITNEAMEGRLDFQSALEERLSIIRPSQKDLIWLGQKYIDTVVDGAVDLIHELLHVGKHIYIISGGFMEAVVIFATFLGIPTSNVYSNQILFDRYGNYMGFNKANCAARSNGKAEVARTIQGSKVMVGDGASDFEVRNSVDLFIGFCGVKKRKLIEVNADIVVYDPNLMSLAPLLIGKDYGYNLSDQIKFNRIDLANKFKAT